MKYLLALVLLCFPAQFVHSMENYFIYGEDRPYSRLDCTPYIHKIVGSYEFDGDRSNQFAGDVVVVLDDQSQWKMHPKQSAQYEQWQIGESVHVTLRTSWYWFNREHMFALYNHEREESVFVMLIWSPHLINRSGPNQCVETTNGVCTGRRRNLELSDESLWEIASRKKDRSFLPANFVYPGYYQRGKKISLFLICGNEREAEWRWAVKGNYTYNW